MPKRIWFLSVVGAVGLSWLALIGILFLFRGPVSDLFVNYLAHSQGNDTEVFDQHNHEPLVDMVAVANAAVVSVVATKDMPVYERYYEEYSPFGGRGFVIPQLREQGVQEREVGGGSGFLVSQSGLLVTNRHVVMDTEARYSVVFSDGTIYEVSVLARDPVLDVAILQIETPTEQSFPYLQFGDSDTLQLGQRVVAIGNALAEFNNTVSVGVVSGLSRSVVAQGRAGILEQLDQVIQTDAALNPGNSGGPLLSVTGEVVGVNVATSLQGENISFALPGNAVAQIVQSVAETGEIVRPFLGVRYSMLTPQLVRLEELSVQYGARVARGWGEDNPAVIPGSPADQAGIRAGDIIIAIDERHLEQVSLAQVLRVKSVGQVVAVTVWRDGEEVELEAKLSTAP